MDSGRLLPALAILLFVGCGDDAAPSSLDGGDVGDAAPGDAAEDSTADGTTADGAVPDGGVGTCTTHADCVLVNDCCTCGAQDAESEVPVCPADCEQAKCDAIGATHARCESGSCVLGYACEPGNVFCRSLPPECPTGEVPVVAGACWAGTCATPLRCDRVADCDACGDHMCVRHRVVSGVPDGMDSVWQGCQTLPADCGPTASCACAGEACGGIDCRDFAGGIECQTAAP